MREFITIAWVGLIVAILMIAAEIAFSIRKIFVVNVDMKLKEIRTE